jgi:UDP-glucose 4-epimerase
MARFLITGIAGFIGSSLAHRLVAEGHMVHGVDNLSTGRMENLESIKASIQFEQTDILDLGALRLACAGVDFVLHQAALPSVQRSVEDPLTSHHTNVDGTLNVMVAARDAGVKRVIYAASSSAYGDCSSEATHEEMCPQPLSPYAAQKLSGELYIRAFCETYHIEAICLRYFNVFGPRQREDSPYSGVIAQFIRRMMTGSTPIIHGDGVTTRDYTYVSNAVQANLLACAAPRRWAQGRVYNVGTGCSRSLNELYRTLAELMGHTGAPTYGPGRTGDVRHSRASIDRITRELGYRPETDFRVALETTIAWYMQQLAKQTPLPAMPMEGTQKLMCLAKTPSA